MEQFTYSLREKVNKEIRLIESEESDIFQKSIRIIILLEGAFEQLKEFMIHYTFKCQSEEIQFFKEIKPQLFSQLVYYRKIYNLEMRMPTGSCVDKKQYLETTLGRIKYFFDMNSDFYQYYRSGSNHLDKYYFLRGKPDIQLVLDSFYFERDARFSTNFDFKVSKMIANEMLTVYINNKLLKFNHPQYSLEDNPNLPRVRFTWTGKKAELIEQIYAWIESNSFNNGNVNIKDLVSYIENVFNIDLGDFYHAFLEMRERKGSRTIFLDKLIKLLNDRMDEADTK